MTTVNEMRMTLIKSYLNCELVALNHITISGEDEDDAVVVDGGGGTGGYLNRELVALNHVLIGAN